MCAATVVEWVSVRVMWAPTVVECRYVLSVSSVSLCVTGA